MYENRRRTGEQLEKHRIWQTGYRARNREIINLKQKVYSQTPDAKQNRKEYYARNRVSMLLRQARKRARAKNLQMNITAMDLVIPELCPVLQIPITPGGPDRDHWPSIDRFDNARGYVVGNVRIISCRANYLKSDATIDELEKVIKYMRNGSC